MDQILDELGEKWQYLSNEEQMALAQTVGGVRQYTQLIALMNNYKEFKSNVDIAAGSEGTLQQQQNIFAESWEAASKRVKAAYESIYQDLLSDKAFIKLTDELAELLKVLDNIIDRMGGLKGVLTQLAPILLNTFNKQITEGLRNTAYSLQMMVPGQRGRVEAQRNKLVDEQLQKASSSLGIDKQTLKEDIELQRKFNKATEGLDEEQQKILNAVKEQYDIREQEYELILKQTQAEKDQAANKKA